VKISPAERERRRQVALELHRQGRLGTRSHQSAGGKAKARKASELAQQLVQDNRAAIEKTLREILRDGSKTQKLRAIESIMKLGLSAERLDTVEQRTDLERLSREQALALLEEKLTTGPVGAILRARMAEQNGQIIEGTTSEVVELRRR
jgi:hypothetical protein